MSKIQDPDIKLAEDVWECMDHNYENGIRIFFNKAGKTNEFNNDGTEAELQEKQKLYKNMGADYGTGLYCTLKLTDIYTRSAQRKAQQLGLAQDVDAAFAHILTLQNKPKKNTPEMTQDHIDMLKRYQMDALAAVLERA